VGTGTNTITVAVTDGYAQPQTAKTNFTITITSNLAYISSGAITLGPGYPAQPLAGPYPSVINVSNVGGLVSGVQVELIGVTNNNASDINVLLVSPDGQHSVVLMANAGTNLAATNLNLTFSQAAGSASLAQTSQLTNGTYFPSNYASSLVFTNGPTNAYSLSLNNFIGVAPSGAWKLYVMDLGYPDSGGIASWILFLQTGPAITSITNVTVAENGSTNLAVSVVDSSTYESNLTVTYSLNGGNTTPLTVAVQGTNTALGLTNLLITPAANYPSIISTNNSTNFITVTVTDTNVPPNVASETIQVVVTYVAQPPAVSASTANLVISENGSGSVTFTVSDVDSWLFPSNLNLTCTNPAFVVSSGIVTNSTISSPLLPPTPGTVTYTVTPVANVFGTSALQFTAGNTNNKTTTSNITLTVTHVVQPPTIAPFFAGSYGLYPGTTSTNIAFRVTTLESNATLTITASSSAPSEVPNGGNNILISPASFSAAAPGADTGTIEIIVPSGAPAGSTTITVTNTQVVGASTLTATASFIIQVLASPTTVFASSGPITNTAANRVDVPYASANLVSGMVGGVFSVAVTLNSLSANVPNDVTILLQAPSNGPAVVLLSDAGGTSPSANLTLTFADTNSLAPSNTPLAANGGLAAFHPTSYNGITNSLPAPAPGATNYFDRMAVFNSLTNANGSWLLWVVDNTTGNTNIIANGWTLAIATAPLIALDSTNSTNVVIPENGAGQNNQGTVSFNVQDSTGGGASDKVFVTSPLFSSNQIAVAGPAVANGNPVDYTATFTPGSLVTGSNIITFTVTRADGSSGSTTFPVLITKSNMAPVLTRLGTIITNQSQTGQTEFFVTEVGDPLTSVTVAAYSSNTAIVANSNLTFTAGSTTASPGKSFPSNVVSLANFASSVANAGDLILNMTPLAGAVGSVQIWVFATNADSAFNSPQVTVTNFTFTIIPAVFNPTFSNVPPSVSVVGGNPTTNINFQVNSLDAGGTLITVIATNQNAGNGLTVGAVTSSGGPALYNGTSTNTNGTTWTVSLTAGATTTQYRSTILLTATDTNGGTATTTFQVVTVPSLQHYYSNSAPINIVDVSPSIPSPSTIPVSGLVGLVSQVVVTVNGFGHQYPSDVGMLLVGAGTNTVLMNNAGSGVPVTGLNLTFSELATNGPVPPSLALTTGTFLPSDYQPVKPYNFETNGINNPTPPNPLPPNGPYQTNLNVFNGLNPNTNWYLYVQDDSAGDVGYITGGWTLQIFTQPQILMTGLTSITNAEGSASGKTSFTILDDSAVAATNYATNSFGATSTNSSLIPAANVTFQLVGNGTNWQVNFNPTVNVTGTSTISIFATNTYGQVASNKFQITVTNVNFPPIISQPLPGSVITVPAGTVTTIPLVYSDTGFNTNALIVSNTSVAQLSANPLPSGSLAFVGNGLGPSNLVVTPVGLVTGSNLITITVTQPGGGSASSTNVTFAVVVVPSTVPLFINTNAITINANTNATPYPSQITVSNVGANIYKVTPTLIGFTHTFPSDVSVLLVGPLGTNVMLMSDEGDGSAVANVRLAFDDVLGVTMPANGPLTNGTYAPAASDLNYLNSLPDVNLPFVTNLSSHTSITAPYGHALGAFTNSNPNGVWSLYVYDNNQPDTGVIASGWSLSIQTIGPMIAPLSPVTMSENTSVTIPLSVASSLTAASNITITPAASAQVPAGLIASSNLVLGGIGTSNPTLTITPTTNYPSAVTNSNGVATVTLTLTDTNTNTAIYSFPLTVLYVDVPPTIILPVTATNTPANVPLSVVFTTKDVQGSALAVSASLSTNLGTVAITTNALGNYTLTFTPVGTTGAGVTGLTTVSIVASDTNVPSVSTTNTLPLTVTAGLNPSAAIVSATNTPENVAISVPFTLANVPAGFSRTNLVGIASNTNLVSFVGFTGISSNFTVNLTLVPYRTGSSTITIT
jgi:subtilisin-like proprotein convertase family protein